MYWEEINAFVLRYFSTSYCKCGWLSDKSARYPMAEVNSACGGAAAVHTCHWRDNWDAFCYMGMFHRRYNGVQSFFSECLFLAREALNMDSLSLIVPGAKPDNRCFWVGKTKIGSLTNKSAFKGKLWNFCGWNSFPISFIQMRAQTNCWIIWLLGCFTLALAPCRGVNFDKSNFDVLANGGQATKSESMFANHWKSVFTVGAARSLFVLAPVFWSSPL